MVRRGNQRPDRVRYRKLELALFIENASDETIQLLKLQTGGIPYANRYNTPRTFGLGLKCNW